MSIVSGIVPSSGGSSTSDATAEQWHIKNGKTAYIASGKVTGNAYTPAMMQVSSGAYYGDSTLTCSGNKVTLVGRFKRATFSDGGSDSILRVKAGAPQRSRMYVILRASNVADADEQGRLVVHVVDTAGTTVCYLVSNTVLADDETHTFLASFDGDSGLATFIVDGADEDNTGATNRVAPTTGTLATANAVFSVGSADNASSVNPLDGQVGFIGYHDVYLTDWTDFMRSDGSPKALDESTWAEWTSQPLYWNPHGDMVNNLGSAGAMTKNGTINVGDGGAT